MFTLHPIQVSRRDQVQAARCGDPHQQLFGFIDQPPGPHWFAEHVSFESGLVLQSSIYEDPFHALWDLTVALLEDLWTPHLVEYP